MTRYRLSAVVMLSLMAACIDFSSPTSGVESVSTVMAAYPAAVFGDTLRDSTGVAQPLSVVAFTGRGDTILSPEGLLFFLPDSGVDARVENRFFIAGARLGPVRVFGQVNGIQTPARTIEVVPPPTITRADPESLGNPATVATVQYRPGDATVTSPGLNVRVRGDTAGQLVNVNGWVVTYRITRQPARREGVAGLPAFFPGTSSKEFRTDSTVTADTTADGVASRSVVIRPILLESFTAVDTVVVEAAVKYRGAPVNGSPVVFRIPVAPRPAATP